MEMNAAHGTDQGRKRENVFNPNLFIDQYGDMKMANEGASSRLMDNKCDEQYDGPNELLGCLEDHVAMKLKPVQDRFDRTVDAMALTQMLESVRLPHTVGIYAEKYDSFHVVFFTIV